MVMMLVVEGGDREWRSWLYQYNVNGDRGCVDDSGDYVDGGGHDGCSGDVMRWWW